MERVNLPGTDLSTSKLGFGCSALLGPKSRQEARELLETAFDAGIRHFDVARLYGYGDAEGVVGDFIQGRREKVTITTKFGIMPGHSFPGRELLVEGVREIMRLFPPIRRLVRSQSDSVVQDGAFSVEEAKASLHTSLRELGTDYIDILLLHDCSLQHCRDELLRFLEKTVEQGKVRQFGVGTSIDQIIRIQDERSSFTDVVQFPNSVLTPNARKLPGREEQAVITHGALKDVEDFVDYLSSHPQRADRWSDQLNVDCTDRNTLVDLLLNFAVQDNPGGLVLFSSTNPEHIKQNAQAISEPSVEPSQVDRFSSLIDDHKENTAQEDT